MDDRQRNIIVGLTALAGLAGLVAMLMTFGSMRTWFEQGYEVTVYLADAGGLAPGSRVKLRGMDVGGVRSVQLLEPVTKGVKVVAEIDPQIRIPRGASGALPLSLIGGTPQLHIRVDFEDEDAVAEMPDKARYLAVLQAEDASAEAVAEARAELEGLLFVGYLPTDGSAVIYGHSDTILDQFKDSLAGPLQSIGSVASDVTRVADDFNALSAEWTAVGANIRVLTDSRSPEDVDGGDVAANLATVLARADARLTELRGVIADVDRYVSDEAMREDLRVTLANAREATEQANAFIGGINERVADVQNGFSEAVASLRRRYVALADDFSGAVAPLQQLLGRAEQGEGTVGKLFNDSEVYDNLQDATERLELMIDEARLLLQKWKAEGVPVQF